MPTLRMEKTKMIISIKAEKSIGVVTMDTVVLAVMRHHPREPPLAGINMHLVVSNKAGPCMPGLPAVAREGIEGT